MRKPLNVTRDPSKAPEYAHWHMTVRYPSGIRSPYGARETRAKALDDMKADREMSRDGFARYVNWCTCPSSMGCYPTDR